ncbi:hypothetical protein Sulba_1999 [Sulfurospirillum barnesii SES-3]|uniref:Uncharacterized protein n=2 Tax=Sulfurospirillum barnesii TaxID=44674 RepID=I3XZA4_SULBS|nr:hypothetical protein Sulba_1999 [Sulfurospirillum barnesii SES-3]
MALGIVGTCLQAHTLLMNILNNDDNTLTVHGEFSTGELASGALIRLESLISGEVLFQQRLPESSELLIAIPKEPYQVVLDGGPGHTVVKEGFAPNEGFSVTAKASQKGTLSQAQNGNKEWSMPMIFLLLGAGILMGLTLYFSYKNTRLILIELQKR